MAYGAFRNDRNYCFNELVILQLQAWISVFLTMGKKYSLNLWIKITSRWSSWRCSVWRQRGTEGGSSFLFKCVMASPRPSKPSESSTPNHAHTRTIKKKNKEEKNLQMENVHFTLKNSEQSCLCVLKREGNHTGVYCTDISFKIVTEDVGRFDRQTTWMPTRWKIISCKEYGTWYHLFIRPTEEPLVNDISQVEVMEHSLSVILYYTDSSAICVSVSLS